MTSISSNSGGYDPYLLDSIGLTHSQALSRYKSNLKKSVQLINVISKMSMDQETKDYVTKNASIIKRN